MFDKLLKPLNYLLIKHDEKRWFDLFFPLILALLLTVLLASLPKPISYLGKEGLVGLVNGILQILSGFYIASMAAVSTFQRRGMDDVMQGLPPKLKGKALTRREFLSYLFGYLAFMSIIMYFVGGFVLLTASSVSSCSGLYFYNAIKYILIFIYLFIISNILITTILGMHFLIDKINSKSPRFSSDENKDDED